MTTIKALRYTPQAKLPLHRLPFICKASPEIGGISFWSVPKTGGYGGGCETGRALAYTYLKYLREHGKDFNGGTLQGIALDMFKDGAEDNTTRGQVVGFFATLDQWLTFAAQEGGAELDKFETSLLIKDANRGLAYTQRPLNIEE